ncbi:DUF680 domain-containing protein [Mesorhizobium sp. LjRoot246]|uniref:DUF680 domain-containing protein n=1 Tax=Mesorhizobium sp. LjRoot246 TaxID=3342294 RepID=UPI003ECF2EE1
MNKIALAAAAILIATATAFAGSDKFGSNNASQPAVTSTDSTITTSIRKSDVAVQKPVTQGGSRDLFGNR